MARSSEAFGNCPGRVAEELWSGIAFDTIDDVDGDQLETDQRVRQSVIWRDEVIGIDGVEGDVAFSTDLGIGAAREFEMDRERNGIGHRISLGFGFAERGRGKARGSGGPRIQGRWYWVVRTAFSVVRTRSPKRSN
jgi:hypothetical protein